MGPTARPLDPQSRRQLQQLAHGRSLTPPGWRARLVLAFFEGSTYRQVAQRFGCSQCTLARWVGRFRPQGLEGLQSRPRQSSGRGRHQQLLAVLLPQTVHLSPRALAVAQDRWTLQALQAQCFSHTGQRPSLESVRRALKRWGYSWKRAKCMITRPDPDYQEKRGHRRAGDGSPAGGKSVVCRPKRGGAVSAGGRPVESPGPTTQAPHPRTQPEAVPARRSGRAQRPTLRGLLAPQAQRGFRGLPAGAAGRPPPQVRCL